jgi:hypothetical protein
MSFIENSKERRHYGVILGNGNRYDWDSGSATFGSIFVDKDEPKKIFLYYTGANDETWSHSAIGLSTSSDGIHFTKSGDNPILEGPPKSFCAKEALTPIVTRLNNMYYMVLAGRPTRKSQHRIGIACADSPEGPWKILRQLIAPKQSWEGHAVDCGPSIIPQGNSILFYYSNILSSRNQAMVNWFRSPSFTKPLSLLPPFTPSIRHTIRCIGIAEIEITDNDISKMRVHRFPDNPLQHLNGTVGSWNESLFCPGYLKLPNKHLLFPTTSTYSIGFPYQQYIGVVESVNPFFKKNECGKIRVMIDGSKEKKQIMPSIKSEIALDTPSPLIQANGKLHLYYSVMDRGEGTWKTALTVFG